MGALENNLRSNDQTLGFADIFPNTNGQTNVHPPKQTWNLKMDPWKRRFLLETIISRFHVNFWECILPNHCFELWNMNQPLNLHPVENRSFATSMFGSEKWSSFCDHHFLTVFSHAFVHPQILLENYGGETMETSCF